MIRDRYRRGRFPPIGFDRLPDADLALAFQDMRQGSVPGLAVGPVQLHLQHLLMALPGLIEKESVLVTGIPVQNRGVIGRLVLHRIQHVTQPLQELVAPVGQSLEPDDIGDGHDRPHAG
jgi:hypothetical protein